MKNVKIFCRIFAFLFAFSIFAAEIASVPASAAFEPDAVIYSEGVYMINMDTDIVVYEKNASQRFYPASTTKIMTAIVAMENITDLDANVRITYDATNEFWEGDPNKEGPSNAALEAGQDNITYRDCLYALLVSSACEAANVLAINVCGSVEAFVSKMNEKAAELGCIDTHFANTHGLWEADNYTTPYDLYLISKYAYDKVPGFMEICDTTSYDLPANTYNPDGYTKYTTNALISNSSENSFYYEYAHGIKTGSIDYYWDEAGNSHAGGRCLVTTATRNGFNYMIVSMWAPYFNDAGESYNYAAYDHVTLYKWAFSTFSYVTVLSRNDVIGEVKVEQGEGADHVSLVPVQDYSTLLPSYLDMTTIQTIVDAETTVTAPVEKGQVMGTVELKLADETMIKVNLIASSGVERSQIAYITEQVKNITDTTWFKLCAVLLAAMIIALVVLVAIRRRQRRLAARKAARKNRTMYK